MTNPTHGNIVRLVDIRKEEVEDTSGIVYIGYPLSDILLRTYADKIDKICCVKCSDRRCKKRDGSCWEYE